MWPIFSGKPTSSEMDDHNHDAVNDHDRLVVVEQRLLTMGDSVEEIRADVKVLLTRKAFLDGIGTAATKGIAIAAFVISIVSLSGRLLHLF